MNTLEPDLQPVAVDVEVTDTVLHVVLEDGRELSVPVEWFPRLRDADSKARQNWRFIGKGEGIHWPDIDEDISVAGLLAGRMRQRAKPKAA